MKLRRGSDRGKNLATILDMNLRPKAIVPILGAVVGAAAGLAFYIFIGCDSG